MKKFIKRLLTSSDGLSRIRFGVSKGMMTRYSPDHRTQHLLGLYEREIYPFLRRGIGRSQVLIDVGANDGYYGLCFMKYPNRQVTLVEPAQDKLELLENLKLNGFVRGTHFKLIEKFVGSDPTRDIRLDDLVPRHQKVLVLMDIEGGEKEVMASYSYDRDKNVTWLIEVHSLEIEQSIMDNLRRHGYGVTVIDHAWWRWLIKEHRPLPHNRWLYAEII